MHGLRGGRIDVHTQKLRAGVMAYRIHHAFSLGDQRHIQIGDHHAFAVGERWRQVLAFG